LLPGKAALYYIFFQGTVVKLRDSLDV